MIIGRNHLREKALTEGYDYFFNLDQDVIPPKDTLKKLVETRKKVVTGIYYNYFKRGENWEKTPILYRELTLEETEKIEEKGKDWLKAQNWDLYSRLEGNNWDYTKSYTEFTAEEVENDKLLKIANCGTGCILIHKDILAKLDFKFNQGGGFDDVIFCDEVRKLLNETLWCDTSVKCEHLIKEKP